ncbi:hypothetical protein ACLOJK_010752 [Asimina triloba]
MVCTVERRNRGMADESSSWVRRANFSHTVCHRLDPSRVPSLPFSLQHDRDIVVKPKNSRAGVVSPTWRQPQAEQVAPSKQRSISPLPDIALSDAFKEARSNRQRFSTPLPRRKERDKKIPGEFHTGHVRLSHFNDHLLPSSPHCGPEFLPPKGYEKSKNPKVSSWSKYFDHGGGRVSAVNAMEEWMVDLSKLFLGLKFASGAHSRLYHGLYKDQPVAVKMILVPDDDENGEMAARLEKQFTREVTILSHLHHKNVIKNTAIIRPNETNHSTEAGIKQDESNLKLVCRKPPVFCVITEYLAGGSLRAFLHKLEHKPLPLQRLIAIALNIARGMEYIHSQGVIHCDLKPENILFDENFCLKIADFGIACEEAYRDSLADDPGTYRWMAPEMIKHKPYGRKVDVYSFGLVLWEMVSGTIPYEDMNPIQAAFAVVNKNLRPMIPGECPAALRALIVQCWCVLPEKRPEFWQIVKVFEQFESSLTRDGTLNLVQNSTSQDHKKGLAHWIQKLGHANHDSSSRKHHHR